MKHIKCFTVHALSLSRVDILLNLLRHRLCSKHKADALSLLYMQRVDNYEDALKEKFEIKVESRIHHILNPKEPLGIMYKILCSYSTDSPLLIIL